MFPRRLSFKSDNCGSDQAAICAGLDLRQWAMNPTPAKPKIIIAQLEASGTAELRLRASNVIDDALSNVRKPVSVEKVWMMKFGVPLVAPAGPNICSSGVGRATGVVDASPPGYLARSWRRNSRRKPSLPRC
jgi:hypothetical protein